MPDMNSMSAAVYGLRTLSARAWSEADMGDCARALAARTTRTASANERGRNMVETPRPDGLGTAIIWIVDRDNGEIDAARRQTAADRLRPQIGRAHVGTPFTFLYL